jgi:hypothetical protein
MLYLEGHRLMVHVTHGDVTPYFCIRCLWLQPISLRVLRHTLQLCRATFTALPERCPSKVIRYAEKQSYCVGIFAILNIYLILSIVHNDELNITPLCHDHRNVFRSEGTEKITVWQWRTEVFFGGLTPGTFFSGKFKKYSWGHGAPRTGIWGQ